MINLSLFSKDNDLFYWFSMEEQVISRAHRMGATRPIHVETLAMRGTIEEQMVHFLQVNQSLTVSWLSGVSVCQSWYVDLKWAVFCCTCVPIQTDVQQVFPILNNPVPWQTYSSLPYALLDTPHVIIVPIWPVPGKKKKVMLCLVKGRVKSKIKQSSHSHRWPGFFYLKSRIEIGLFHHWAFLLFLANLTSLVLFFMLEAYTFL